MYTRVTVEHCEKCEESTPHSRRVIALPKWVGVVAVVGVIGLFVWESEESLLGGLLGVIALVAFGIERRTPWRIECERCRNRELRALRRRHPSLPGGSEITFL